jgi:hypothetical protein
VTLQNPRNPTTRLKLEAFGNPGRTKREKTRHKSAKDSRNETQERPHRQARSGESQKSHTDDGEEFKQGEPGSIATPCRLPEREMEAKQKQEAHQNTVSLRVSQLEGVAATATRLNSLK